MEIVGQELIHETNPKIRIKQKVIEWAVFILWHALFSLTEVTDACIRNYNKRAGNNII